MFAALKISDRSRVTSITTQWDDKEEVLRELARDGELVCPGCEQLLWLRTGEVRRRHFAHRDLSECPVGKDSAEVLEAKAQLFTWLETKFPSRVQIDMDLETPAGRLADIVVDLEDGRRFIYWIFDRQIRDRLEFRIASDDPLVQAHYIHTEQTLKSGPDGGIVLSASQRDFITYGEFDLALTPPGVGHLHFILGSEQRLRVYQGLHCVHGPGLHEWNELRESPLANALIDPKSGEIVFAEDVVARDERRKVLEQPQTLSPKPDIERAARKRKRKSRPLPSASPEKTISLSRPLKCEDCGVETTNWSVATPSQGTCVCNPCIRKRLA